MRYLGGKSLLLDNILEVINNHTENVKTIIDVFSGSGIVSKYLKENGYKLHANDFLYFSYVLNRGTLDLNKRPSFKNLKIDDPISYLNNLSIEDTKYSLEECFIYNNYSPHDFCERMYFTKKNAIKIDIIRKTIEEWKLLNSISEDEYYYLLACLISAVPYISNITGTYGAYLKYWDKRALNDLKLIDLDIIKSTKKSNSYNLDYVDCLKSINADLLYADPPYNSRQYLSNYHILETIAKYDNPYIKGKTGVRAYDNQKSTFCIKNRVKESFEMMIKNAKVNYIVISYNNEGILSTEELSEICEAYAEYGTFKLFEIDYRRYKNKIPNNKEGLKEQIYFFKKKKEEFDKSPMNYIGGKYKILPQILKLFPKKINNMVDLFVGGCDVCTNINAKNIFANDINTHLIDIYKAFQSKSIQDIILYIENKIEEYDLSMYNKESYLHFRKKYNESNIKNPLDLFVLMCYSFNYQFRFNNNHEFNTPFGLNRSSFNSSIKSNLIKFHRNIKNIVFSESDFRDFDISFLSKGDFVYADPPYLITTGTYNDGKRGFNGWSKNDDVDLFKLLDALNEKGVKFALSNVLEHKGKFNDCLINWSKKYKIHYINYDYKNSNYHGKNTDKKTIEVLITNY